MSEYLHRRVSRRQAITGIGLAGAAAAPLATALAQEPRQPEVRGVLRYADVAALQASPNAQAGDWVETLGFRSPGDGGAGLYQVQQASNGSRANDADVLTLQNGLLAVLKESECVNYRLFGAVGDGRSDDGVQIRLAHEYANRHQIPVVNLSGEFWIQQTNGIPISTAVEWGKTVFHIEERYNSRSTPRFVVRNDRPSQNLTGDEELRRALIQKLKPGVQIIPELAPYAGHLVLVQDANDRIGIRAGYAGNRGWAREELFYVEHEGRILGDIAWEFKNLTSVTAIPCNDNYLVIQGGGFYYSGDSPEGSSRGYHHHGILVERSRTVIREQWMGLEPGKTDRSLVPRRGFYVFNSVYDVTLENIRAMPWEKERRPPEKPVPEGTYGIGGARMLNCTFRNLSAEAGPVAWGVFGTNLNKNFRLENCRLNRVDVHFHCWNLYISNCTIGFKGISVTGGGDLFVTDTTRHGNAFISFRRDYGARWDGPIRLRGCTLKPSGNGGVSVLQMHPSDFDYQYPLALGASVAIEDLRIDFGAAPASAAPCWLMDVAPFARDPTGERLLFPQQITFRNVAVTGRERGVRLIRLRNPWHYDVRRDGGCDDSRLRPNCTLICDQVQLEAIVPDRPGGLEQVHLLIGGEDAAAYLDERALYSKIVFLDCENVSLYLGHCAASVFLERCSVNIVTAVGLRGELSFSNCRLQPSVRRAEGAFYQLEASLGTRFTNCTIHVPLVDGQAAPDLLDRLGFIAINKSLRHYHLNTALGAELIKYLRENRIDLDAKFVEQLRSHHVLEESTA